MIWCALISNRNKGARLTDVYERGLLLAVREAERLAPEFIEARISLNDMPVEYARDAINLYAMRYLAKHRKLTPLEAFHYETLQKGLELFKEWPGYAEAVKALPAGKP